MFVAKFFKWFFVSAMLVVLVACGGGSSSGDNNSGINSGGGTTATTATPKTIYTGKFTNVQGVQYKTSSGLEGTTGDDGSFKYHEGDSVSFYVGDAKLGSIKAENIIDVFNFKNSLLVSQVLHSLDNDIDFSNGFNMTAFNTSTSKINKKVSKSTDYILNIDEIDSYDEKYISFLRQNGIKVFPGAKSLAVDLLEKIKKEVNYDENQKVYSGSVRAIRGDYAFHIKNEQILNYAKNNYKDGNYAYRVKVAVADRLNLEVLQEISKASHGKIDEAEELQNASDDFKAYMSTGLDMAVDVIDADGSLLESLKGAPVHAVKLSIETMEHEEYKPEIRLAANFLLDFASADSQSEIITASSGAIENALEVFLRDTLADQYPISFEILNGLGSLGLDLAAAYTTCRPPLVQKDPAECVRAASGAFLDKSLDFITSSIQIHSLGAGQEELNNATVAFELWKANYYTNGDFCKMLKAYDTSAVCEGKTVANNFDELAKAIEKSGYVNITNTFFGDIDIEKIKEQYLKLVVRANKLFTKYKAHFKKFETDSGYVDSSISDSLVKSDVNVDIDIKHILKDDNSVDIYACMNFDSKSAIQLYSPNLKLVDERNEVTFEIDSDYDSIFRGKEVVCGRLENYMPYHYSMEADTAYGVAEYPFLIVGEATFSIAVDNVVHKNYDIEKVKLYNIDVRRQEKESSVNVSYSLGNNYNYILNSNLNDQRIEKSGDPYIYLWDIKLPACNVDFYDNLDTNEFMIFTIPVECRNGSIPVFKLSVYDKEELVAQTDGTLEPYAAADIEELEVSVPRRIVVQSGEFFSIDIEITGGVPQYDIKYNVSSETIVEKDNFKVYNDSSVNKIIQIETIVTDKDSNQVTELSTVEVLPKITNKPSLDWVNRWMTPYSPKENDAKNLAIGENITQQWGIQNTSGYTLNDVVFKWDSYQSNTNLVHSKDEIRLGDLEKDTTKQITLDIKRDKESVLDYDVGYYKAYHKVDGKEISLEFPNSNKQVYLDYKFSINNIDETPPTINSVNVSVDEDSFIQGGFYVFQKNSQVKNLRVHFSSYDYYPEFDRGFVDVETSFTSVQGTGYKSFSFDASRWSGKKVYWKIEAANEAGYQMVSVPSGVVYIPSAPVTNSAPELTKYSSGGGPSVTKGETYYVRLVAKDIDGDSGRLAIIWGDGTNDVKDISSISTSGSIHSFSHTYTSTGTFTWSAQLADDSDAKSTIIKQSVVVSQPASAPVVSSFNASDTGSQGDGKVRVTYSISTDTSLTRVRTHCGVGSGYSYTNYTDSSTSARSVDVTLQDSRWVGQTVYCKSEVIDSNNNKAVVQSDSVKLSTAPAGNSAPELTKYSSGGGPSVTKGETYYVRLVAKDIDGDSGRLAIIWGDGTNDVKDISSISTSGSIHSFSHTYTSTGTFTWAAQLADDSDAKSTIITQSVNVSQ